MFGQNDWDRKTTSNKLGREARRGNLENLRKQCRVLLFTHWGFGIHLCILSVFIVVSGSMFPPRCTQRCGGS